MKIKDFDFFLPKSLIANKPEDLRDRCRLLVLYKDGKIEHRYFCDLKNYLDAGDLLILNNTKVIPAKLIGKKSTGGKLELLIVCKLDKGCYKVLSKKRYTGEAIFEGGLKAYIHNGCIAKFNIDDIREYLWKYGYMPLPPYIKRTPTEKDKLWYQTVYAEKEGSIAAPTAGLHFTKHLLKELEHKGVIIKYITLHVGIGTFKSVKTNTVQEHKMEAEHFEIPLKILSLIYQTKKIGKKVVAVGTTVTRAIEAILKGDFKGKINNDTIKGVTELFIYPGYKIVGIDALITNFHLPRSTPLLLVCAFAGVKNIMNAYKEAIQLGYRFFSYGDGMLILSTTSSLKNESKNCS